MAQCLIRTISTRKVEYKPKKRSKGVSTRISTSAQGGIAFVAGKWISETKKQEYQKLLKTPRNACGYADKKGMTVEPDVFDYDMDKAGLIAPAPLAACFAADMRTTHSNFGLLVDLSHFPTTYEISQFVIRMLRQYITYLHCGNAVVKKGHQA